MQMIATARFKKAFDRAVAARPYTDRVAKVVSELASAAGELEPPLLVRRESKRVALVAIASNRGLCGGYNSNIVRQTVAARREALDAGRELRLFVSGRKLAAALKFQGVPAETAWTQF